MGLFIHFVSQISKSVCSCGLQIQTVCIGELLICNGNKYDVYPCTPFMWKYSYRFMQFWSLSKILFELILCIQKVRNMHTDFSIGYIEQFVERALNSAGWEQSPLLEVKKKKKKHELHALNNSKIQNGLREFSTHSIIYNAVCDL